jgi:hypothetical protein
VDGVLRGAGGTDDGDFCKSDRLSDPKRGYTFDIRIIAQQILPEAFKRKIPLITNGGGLNPIGAAEMVRDTAAKMGLSGLKIAAVTGDDILPRIPELLAAGEPLAHMETGEKLADSPNQMWATANVYLGAAPIVEALQGGADIVITGRVADPCLYLAPLIAHGWAGMTGRLAGHRRGTSGMHRTGRAATVSPSSTTLTRDLNSWAIPSHVEPDGAFIHKTPDTPAADAQHGQRTAGRSP